MGISVENVMKEQAQKVTFVSKILRLFYPQICFNNVAVCSDFLKPLGVFVDKTLIPHFIVKSEGFDDLLF